MRGTGSMRMRPRILTGLLALLVVGCIPKVEQPRVWLEGARLASIGLSGGVVEVELAVHNPNGFELRANGLTYDVELENPDGDGWIDFTDGEIDRELRVGPGETTVVAVPVEFDYDGVGRLLRGLIERGTFDYRVSGVVALDGPIRRDFDYRYAGAVTPTGVR